MAKKDSTLSLQNLNDLFYYSDGNLYRKKSTQKNVLAQSKIGTINTLGYLVVSIKNKTYLVHRLIFWLKNNYLPKYIDHIDGNKLNNSIENLREASNQQNCFNQKLRKTSLSGIKNVRWEERLKKWSVRFTVNYKPKHIGVYSKLEDAIQAASKARQELHKQFARDC
jgi:hypothetical protein